MKGYAMRILIFGAGSTGCYIGAQFALEGIETHVIARQRVIDSLQSSGGVRVSSYNDHQSLAPLPTMHTSLPNLAFDLCLVTLKCHHIDAAANDLIALQRQGCELHFMQNGLGSRAKHTELKQGNCYTGITPFNVLTIEHDDGTREFHQGTEGVLQLQETKQTRLLKQILAAKGMDCELYQDIAPVIYGKLLLNLNNAINAICDLPLKQELENRNLRRVLAGAMREYLEYCKKTNKSLRISSPIPATWLPALLGSPNWLFTRLAKKMLAIDPLARSSMWEDITQGRPTEINYLNGAVAQLCEQEGIPCPINKTATNIIKELEAYSRNEKPGTRPGVDELYQLI
jgi:2-dehydropantoate 2-reductase